MQRDKVVEGRGRTWVQQQVQVCIGSTSKQRCLLQGQPPQP